MTWWIANIGLAEMPQAWQRIPSLRSILGAIKQHTGQYSGGLFLFGAAFFVAALILLQLGIRWRASWEEEAVERAGIFSYRNFAGSPAGETAE